MRTIVQHYGTSLLLQTKRTVSDDKNNHSTNQMMKMTSNNKNDRSTLQQTTRTVVQDSIATSKDKNDIKN